MSSILNCSAIYDIINKRNGKLYVGSALNVRLRVRQHFSRLCANGHISKHFQRAFNQYGEDAFGVVILEKINDPTQLIPREQYYIDLFWPLGGNGYNSSPTAGSTLGIKRPPFSEEWRRNMSTVRKGEKNHFYGRKHNEEARKIISAKTKARMADPTANYFYGKRFTGEQNYMFGRTHTPEARAKIGAVNRGRTFSAEVRQRMSKSRKGRPNMKNRKAVIQLTLQNVEIARHDSLTIAARALKTSITNISYAANGKWKTAKGFLWRFAEV